MSEKLNFEERLAKLESQISEIEENAKSLEETLKIYEDSLKTITALEAELKIAEEKIASLNKEGTENN